MRWRERAHKCWLNLPIDTFHGRIFDKLKFFQNKKLRGNMIKFMEKKIRSSLEITEGKKVDKEQETIKDRVLRKHKRLIRRRKTRVMGSLESSRKKKQLFHKGQGVQQYQTPLRSSITDQQKIKQTNIGFGKK